MNKKFVFGTFFVLVCLSLLAPIWVFSDLLFPYVTSKAFYFRICLEAALPFYVYLLIAQPQLRPSWKNPLNALLLAFLLVNLVSALAGVSVPRSLWGNFERMGGVYYLAHLTLLYFYVLLIAQRGDGYFKKFLQVLLGAALVVTVNGIFGKLGLPILVRDASLPARVSSTLGNPIYIGSYLIIPIFLAWFLGGQEESKIKKWLYWLGAFLFFLCIIFSATRGAMVGLVAGLFLAGASYVVLNPKRRIKLWGSAAVLAFSLFCGFLFTHNNVLPAGSDLRRLFTLHDSNTEARLIQWKIALRGFKDRPWLGVGPENYYFISNKYYNPEIFKYDRSWFDKPHNYLLEILVTEGVVAFALYAAIILAVLWIFYRGYKNNWLSLTEFCLLVAAMVSYQFQNLTVFDTVPASLMFYSFVGVAGFIWLAASATAKQANFKNQKRNAVNAAEPLAMAAGGLTLLFAIYLIYVTNAVPIQAAKAVNYGYAYAQVDPNVSDSYFQAAMSLPFNFDLTESASKYGEAVSSLARAGNPKYGDITAKMLQEAEAALKQALDVQPNYPILWQRLADVYIVSGLKDGKIVSLDPRAELAIEKAMDLAPGREEAQVTLAQIRLIQGRSTEAETILKGLIQAFPQDFQVRMQLAGFYRYQNRMADAAEVVEQAVKDGYKFTVVEDAKWLVSYYLDKKNYENAVTIVQQLHDANPQDLGVAQDLAQIYLMSGQKDKAQDLARQIVAADPTRQKDLQNVFDGVPGSGVGQ